MDNTEAEEQLASEMLLNQKLEELDEAYQTKISHVYDYANFTLPVSSGPFLQ